ncbi:MAG: hypothetical protein F6K00_06395 [Leptolyngbya sp. SIOISBB]|nr:hypothetical protein [Leptolyngbya sp. SIOISBB]
MVADVRGQIHQWDWPAQAWRGTWSDHTAKVTSLALSHDGQLLASGDSQGSIKVWDWQTQTGLRTLSQQPGAITAIAWLPGDDVLVTAGWDVTLRWRCPQTGGTWQTAKAAGFYLPVRSLLPHTTKPWVVAGSQDGQLQLWTRLGQSENTAPRKSEIGQTAALSGALIALQPLCQNGDSEECGFLSLTARGQLTQWLWSH